MVLGQRSRTVLVKRRPVVRKEPTIERVVSFHVRSVLQPASRPQDVSFVLPPSESAEHDLGGRGRQPLEGKDWKVLPDVWAAVAAAHGDQVALVDPHRPEQPTLTYLQLHEAIQQFAWGLRSLGLRKGDCVALFSENSYRWLIADQGIMTVGACDAVRGTRSSTRELLYILRHSDCTALVVETDDALQRLMPGLTGVWEERPSAKSEPSGTERELGPQPPSQLQFVVVLWPSEGAEAAGRLAEFSRMLGCPVVGFGSAVEAGRSAQAAFIASGSGGVVNKAGIRPDDVATLVFTSGTTGNPKAVMLTHANLMHQILNFQEVIPLGVGSVLLSLLPPWHMYERAVEYHVMSRGMRLIYSGVQTFKEDLVVFRPDILVAVPLVFNVLYTGVQRKLASAVKARAAVAKMLVSASLAYMRALRRWRGLAISFPNDVRSHSRPGSVGTAAAVGAAAGTLIAGILVLLLRPLHWLASLLIFSKVKEAIPIRQLAVSGGGSLPPHIDHFFEAMGLTLLNGYGLTETSPVITCRRPDHNVLGTVGSPLPMTQVKVVDPDTGDTLPDGAKGVVKAKGPQIMKGYYKDPTATAAVIDGEGWFSTGDLGWISPAARHPLGPSRNCARLLILDGRAKDTIVLANGENVEPAWIEEAAMRSPAVSQIMLIGQDRRKLAALVVPNKEELDAMVCARRAADKQPLLADRVLEEVSEEERQDVVKRELVRCLAEAGCGSNERIGAFALIQEPFTVENGLLTATLKMKRDAILERHRATCERLLAQV